MPRFYTWSFSQVSPPRPCINLSPIRAIRPTPLILLGLVTPPTPQKIKSSFLLFLNSHPLKIVIETYAINYEICTNLPAIF